MLGLTLTMSNLIQPFTSFKRVIIEQYQSDLAGFHIHLVPM